MTNTDTMWIRWANDIHTDTGVRQGWFACLLVEDDPLSTRCGLAVNGAEMRPSREDEVGEPYPCADCA